MHYGKKPHYKAYILKNLIYMTIWKRQYCMRKKKTSSGCLGCTGQREGTF